MAKRKPTDKFNLPAGTLKGFVCLETPSPKYDSYSATVLVEGEVGDKLKTFIDKIVAYNAKITGKSDTYNPAKMTDAGLEVKIKNKGSYTTKKGDVISCKPGLWDTENKKVDSLLGIGEGTTCIIQVEPYLWATSTQAGVTLQPKNIQILELVKFESAGSASPFDKVDGAFKANNDDVFGDDDADDDFDDPTEDFSDEDEDDVPF